MYGMLLDNLTCTCLSDFDSKYGGQCSANVYINLLKLLDCQMMVSTRLTIMHPTGKNEGIVIQYRQLQAFTRLTLSGSGCQSQPTIRHEPAHSFLFSSHNDPMIPHETLLRVEALRYQAEQDIWQYFRF